MKTTEEILKLAEKSCNDSMMEISANQRNQTSTTTKIDLNNERLQRKVTALFKFFALTYQAKWASSLPDGQALQSLRLLWAKKLAALSDAQIKNAMEKLHQRPNGKDDFPPSIAQFYQLATESVIGAHQPYNFKQIEHRPASTLRAIVAIARTHIALGIKPLTREFILADAERNQYQINNQQIDAITNGSLEALEGFFGVGAGLSMGFK